MYAIGAAIPQVRPLRLAKGVTLLPEVNETRGDTYPKCTFLGFPQPL
jgi:hypothetical protein